MELSRGTGKRQGCRRERENDKASAPGDTSPASGLAVFLLPGRDECIVLGSFKRPHLSCCKEAVGPAEVESAEFPPGRSFSRCDSCSLLLGGKGRALREGNLIKKKKKRCLICTRQTHFQMPAEISSSSPLEYTSKTELGIFSPVTGFSAQLTY